MPREFTPIDESIFKTAPCIERYPDPVLTYKDVPYKAALTFNAGVLKKENGKYKSEMFRFYPESFGWFL